MKKLLSAAFMLLLLWPPLNALGAETLKVGFNLPLTGDIPKIGESSKLAAELLRDKINSDGGFEAAGKRYKLEFIYVDNEAKPDSAVSATNKLILKDGVLFMVGPQSSSQAIPAGEVANAYKTPMISPWSTNPKTTLARPYVMRACFLDSFQGPVAAQFASQELKAKKAAVLFDIASDYPNGLARDFKDAFERANGPGSVVAFESFTTKDVDFSAQLTKIVAAKPDFIFVPQFYSEVPLIVRQAHDLGFNKPFLGSDGWDSAELMNLCGDDCKGQFFVTHYAAAGATGATKQFVDDFKARYGYVPDNGAALTFDAINLMLRAVKESGWPSGNLAKEREALARKMRQIENFEGITGKMTFSGSGDPLKCAVIVRISQDGEFVFHQSVCPH